MHGRKQLELPLFFGYVKKLDIAGAPIVTMCSTKSQNPPKQPRLVKSRLFIAFLVGGSTGSVVFTSSSIIQSEAVLFPRFQKKCWIPRKVKES